MVPSESELVGINWPEVLSVGALNTQFIQAPSERIDEESGMIQAAVYLTDPPTLMYSPKQDPRRRDNDICHELAHLLEHQVLGGGLPFTDSEAHSVGNFLHVLIAQVLAAYGIDPYVGLDIKRPMSLEEVEESWNVNQAESWGFNRNESTLEEN